MISLYGHRWASAYSADANAPAAEVWAHALAGLTGDDLKRGLDACMRRADPWPPTLPEFKRLCLGIPTWQELRVEFARCDNQPRSPFARMVLMHLDHWEYRSACARDAQRLLHDAYDIAVHARLDGEPEPPELPELEPPAPRLFVPATQDVARRHIANILEMLGARPEASAA